VAGRSKALAISAAVLAAALCCLGGLLAGERADAQAEDPRPNFVIVMADDLHPAMMRALPSVERLIGNRGTTFENAIASYPLCCPSRASLLTGQYAHNHGAKGNNPKSGGGYKSLLDPERNLAAWLQASGYDTAFAGKWLNGFRTPRKAPPGWSAWWGLIGSGGEGLSSFYDFEIFNGGKRPAHFGTRPADYQTDVLTREYAVPFIETRATDPDPFFLWLPYHPPHSGLGRDDFAGRRCSTGPPASRSGKQSAIPPPRYARRYLHARLPKSRSYDERDVSDKPRFLRESRLDRSAKQRIERDYRCGLAALLALDDAISTLIDQLRAQGELGETVVVFTADHGVLAGEHRQARGKNLPYEEVLRVPLVVRGPGVAAGRRVPEPVANIDLAPTVLELAGAQVPPALARTIDGASLAPHLAGPVAGPDRALLIEGRKNVAKSRRAFKVRSYVGTRTARYAYVEHRRATYRTEPEGRAAPIGAGRVTDVELYDLRRDPDQLASRHRDPAYADVRARLARLTERLEDCAGESCAVADRAGRPAR
jgi:N-acetylglucosamine-6-sulfatase